MQEQRSCRDVVIFEEPTVLSSRRSEVLAAGEARLARLERKRAAVLPVLARGTLEIDFGRCSVHICRDLACAFFLQLRTNPAVCRCGFPNHCLRFERRKPPDTSAAFEPAEEDSARRPPHTR